MSDDSREYPARPICGVGVVAFQGDQLLLIRRGKDPRKGEWSIPGGAVELGETVRAAAEREFAEECGGEVELGDVVEVIDIIWRDAADRIQYQYVIVDFWGDWKSGELSSQSDVMDARWVSPVELDQFRLPDWTRRVIEKAVRQRARG